MPRRRDFSSAARNCASNSAFMGTNRHAKRPQQPAYALFSCRHT